MHNYDVWLKRFAVVVLVVNFISFVNRLTMISEYVGSAFVIVIESMVSVVIIPALLYGVGMILSYVKDLKARASYMDPSYREVSLKGTGDEVYPDWACSCGTVNNGERKFCKACGQSRR